MSGTIVAIVLAVLSSDVIKELVKGLFGGKKKSVRKEDLDPIYSALESLRNGLMHIHADRLDHLMTKYLREGTLTDTQYKALIGMHESYKALGGNSYIDDKFEKVQELYKSE